MGRGFGVADGVSGWNDFGFSSEAFSHELMNNCKSEIQQFERQSAQKIQDKANFKKMRKRRSFMSMEMMEDREEDGDAAENEIDEDLSIASKKGAAKSIDET